MGTGNTERKDTPAKTAGKGGNKRLVAVCVVLLIGALVLVVYMIRQHLPLDRIMLYQVEVAPRDDGTLDIAYTINWTVLNSIREGPLTWVKIGMANEDFTVVDMDGDIKSQRNQSGPYAAFNLNRAFYKGETASLRFQVHQSRMLCDSLDGSDTAFYDFTPGWFNGMEVKRYRFIWLDGGRALSHNADREQGGRLFWEGGLKKGERRTMEVTYRLDGFTRPETVTWRPQSNYQEDDQETDLSGAFKIIWLTFFVSLCIGLSGRSGYRGGRGYHSGGSGGGCACACAGCACACACAGGGRAGCSNKDFYRSGQLEALVKSRETWYHRAIRMKEESAL